MRSVARAVLFVAVGAVVSACGGDGDPAGSDAAVEPDAFQDLDAFVELDVGSDDDGGPGDGDGDGIAAWRDCDDSDPAIGTTAERSCSNACASGMQTCTDGTWGVCDASTDCLCSLGDTRTVTCFRCGMQMQRCVAENTWEDSGSCINAGTCEVGATETRDTARCGQETRTCTDSCIWGDWVESRAPGPCEAGAKTHCIEGYYFVCSPDCMAPDGCHVGGI